MTMDEAGKTVLNTEDANEDKEEGGGIEGGDDGEEGGGIEGGDDSRDRGEDDGGERREDEEKEDDESKPQATDEKRKTSEASKNKKQPEVLNLNNEVVKMRKEVKRVRVLVIRKTIRQIQTLKKRKGTETRMERNRRRADRLMEQIQALKRLQPDLVTKTALQKKLSYEQVCKNPKSTISERAIASIASHPQFDKKIEDIKAAVKAFKEERMRKGRKGKGQKQDAKEKPLSSSGENKKEEDVREVEKKDEKNNEEEEEEEEGEEDDEGEQNEEEEEQNEEKVEEEEQNAEEVEEEEQNEEEQQVEEEEDDDSTLQQKDVSVSKRDDPLKSTRNACKPVKPRVTAYKHVTQEPVKSLKVTDVDNKPQTSAAGNKPSVRNAEPRAEEESDVSDGEDKPYFDDSTEERFHKQSSQSETSGSDDDFFVGKVSKLKKKRMKKRDDGAERRKRKEAPADEPSEQLQGDLDELESRLKVKAPKLQSVFCSSLSRSKPGGGGRGAGRGGGRFRDQGGSRNRDFAKQMQVKAAVAAAGDPGGEDPKARQEGRRHASEEMRGRGRGRGGGLRGRGGAPTHGLHPSWEASKKRKEQQGQILAYQGKKIKFDD